MSIGGILPFEDLTKMTQGFLTIASGLMNFPNCNRNRSMRSGKFMRPGL